MLIISPNHHPSQFNSMMDQHDQTQLNPDQTGQSRREFIKNSAAVGALAATLPLTNSPLSALASQKTVAGAGDVQRSGR